jgi:hypothetical protein
LANVSKKLAKVVEFTLEKIKFKAFPKICQKNDEFVFGNIH